jgi:hypothetical protein
VAGEVVGDDNSKLPESTLLVLNGISETVGLDSTEGAELVVTGSEGAGLVVTGSEGAELVVTESEGA